MVLYLLYLAMTGLEIDYKVAMTVLYILGMMQTFFLNKAWTFEHRGRNGACLAKYLLAYGLCYSMNVLVLMLFADCMKLPHQIVQATMIGLVAVMMFLLQKYWIFPAPLQLEFKGGTDANSLQ